ncbi:MAG: glycosyltransferase [Solirubrobacteraceae bacterium]
MTSLEHVAVEAMDPRRFRSVIGPGEYQQLLELIDNAARALRGRVIWNVSSTAKGGGVVELLRPLLGYSRGSGVDARWVVITGGREFFEITKRMHNHLHGVDGDGGLLSAREQAVYESTLARNAQELIPLLHPGDIVILHDPQTAGLVSAVRGAGAVVIWRCHVGLDKANRVARGAWSFVRPHVLDADAYVFSRRAFVWDGLAREKVAVIQPSIDAFSAKNAEQTHEQRMSILSRAGIVVHRPTVDPTFTRSDGTPGRVDICHAQMCEAGPLSSDDTLIAQISRWDRLKDPLGVLQGFAQHVAARVDAHLLIAGPATEAVTDDPEGASVHAAVVDACRGLQPDVRRRVHLASLPMADAEQNAAVVNALQGHATVVVQKSLAEGFGLTVTEAMWKQQPVVASRVGGIQDQIVDGESGVLISDPRDLRAFGSAVVGLLSDRDRARRIGVAAQERVRDNFLGPRHLAQYFELIERLDARGMARPDHPSQSREPPPPSVGSTSRRE